jgi:hypothetical protein
MKRQILFSIMVVALAVVNTSCNDKEESIQPTFNHIITVNELMGYWQHQSTEYMGIVITNCDELNASNIPSVYYDRIIFNWKIKQPETGMEKIYDGLCDWFFGCQSGSNDNINNLKLKQYDTENKIQIGSDLVFEVLSYDKTTKILKLKLIKPVEYYEPINAIYTLKKQ